MANIYTGYQYRLRAGSIMPVQLGGFVVHAFMAEQNKIEILPCVTTLPGSEEFRGQSRGNGLNTLISASFSRLGVAGGSHFQGKKVYSPTFVDEERYNVF